MTFSRRLFGMSALTAATLQVLRGQSLSTVRGTIHNLDGTLFTGRLVIAWYAFAANSGVAMPAGQTLVNVYSGFLSVVLVPGQYRVQYESQTGQPLWSETWTVPASWSPVTLAQVRTDIPTVVPPVVPPTPTVPTAAVPLFSDAAKPAGALDGINRTFTLASPPNPASSLMLFRNGVLQSAGVDYSIAASAITFFAAPGPSDLLVAWFRY